MASQLTSMDDLHRCLASAPPVELQGMRLLKERPHFLSDAPQIPREALVAAVTQIIEYTDRCAAAARKLADLGPIPLTSATIPEFGI